MTQKEFELFAQKQAELWRQKHKDEITDTEKAVLKETNIITPRERKIIEKPKYKRYLKVREVAKLVSDNYKIEIGQNRLYDRLREWGLIIPNSTEPYQKAIREGWLVYLPKVIETPYGDKIVYWTKVTPKGTAYIMNKIRENVYG